MPASLVYQWSLTLERPEDSPMGLLSGSYCKLSQCCELIGYKCPSLIRHGVSSPFRTTPDAHGSPAVSQAGRNRPGGNGSNRKNTCSCRLNMKPSFSSIMMENTSPRSSLTLSAGPSCFIAEPERWPDACLKRKHLWHKKQGLLWEGDRGDVIRVLAVGLI